MRTFARKSELKLSSVSVNEIMDRAFDIFSQQLKVHGIEVVREYGSDLPRIKADPDRLEQVFINLLLNARDSIEERWEGADCGPGDKRITVRTGLGEGLVKVEVQDTGGGVDPACRDKIFDPFFTTKEVGKGTGLGLASVYGIAKSHGGHIECDSLPGRGTAFHIYLPAQAPREIESGDTEARAAAGGGRAERVLVVDDEASLRELTGRVLERHGYQVTLAASGEDALAVQNRMGANLDLVVLDLGMPGMGGYRCLEELKRADPGLKVIVLSGYAPDQRVRTALAGAPSVFMSKPYKIDDLLVVVRDVLDAAD
jgi:CheY-like chemotaxis protein